MAILQPFALDLLGRRCLVVGGGGVAARRVPPLLEAGALLTLIAPQIDEALSDLVTVGRIVYWGRAYAVGDARGYALVLAATGVAGVDAQVARDASTGEGLICVAGRPALGNCQFMASIHRGPLLVGVQTGGAAPAVSGAIRRQLDASLPEDLGEVIEQIGSLRATLRQNVPNSQERARRWARVVTAGLIATALEPGGRPVLAQIEQLLLAENGD